MVKYAKAVFFLFIFFISLLFAATCLPAGRAGEAQAAGVSAPTIIEVSGDQSGKPVINGLTQANTDVLVYIDGIYAGPARVSQEGTATDNFYYEHGVILNEGVYEIMLIARDKISLVLSPPSQNLRFVVPPLPAPTMIEPNENTATGRPKPLIKGLTINGTFVRIYIDGVYNGKTDILTHDSGTANFAYRPFLNLSEGEHTVWAIAEDEAGSKSGVSDVLNFRIEKPMPAPVIFTPVINGNTSYNRPFIVGLAKNDSLVKIFIDHKLDGQFAITNHQSSAANFAYLPYLPLTGGRHLVYTTAIDSRGKESSWSNIVYFTVQQPAAAPLAKSGAEIEEPESEQEEPAVVISPRETAAEEIKVEELKDEEIVGEPEVVSGEEEIEEKTQTGEKTADEEIQKIIAEGIEKEKPKEGLINEDKEKQSKLNLNLIIFIVFLLAVAGWIFWVNRELIKEKRGQAGKEEDKTDKQAVKTEEKDESKDSLFPPREQPPLV